MPGDRARMAVAAGATITIQGPGQQLEMLTPQAAWIKLCFPERAGRRALHRQLEPKVVVEVAQVVGGAFEGFDKPSLEQKQHPSEAPTAYTQAPPQTRRRPFGHAIGNHR